MTRHMTASIVAVAVLASACGTNTEQQQAEQAMKEGASQMAEGAEAMAAAATEGAGQMAEGAAAMAKGLEALTQGMGGTGEKVEVLQFEQLGAAFPEVSGWQRGEITGATRSFPIAMSESEVNYQNSDARIRVTVVDTALNQMMFAPITMFMSANFSERTSDGYKKGVAIKGEPGFEEVNTRRETAELTVVVGKRFIVSARGSRGAGIEPVRAVLEQMDFSKLTAAK